MASFSQDSAMIGLPKDAGGLGRRISGAGATIDTLFIYKIGVDTFQRVFTNGEYVAQWGGVFANGSDMTARINRLFNHAKIKTVVIAYDTTSRVNVTGTINIPVGKTLKFGNGAKLYGGGTITGGGTIWNDDYTAIFDSTIHLSNIKSATGKIPVTWWEDVDPTGTNFSDEGIKKAMAIPYVGEVVFPIGVYKTQTQLKLNERLTITQIGVQVSSYTSGASLIVGPDTVTANNQFYVTKKHHTINIQSATQSTWADSASVTKYGVRLQNLKDCEVVITEANGFTVPVLMIGADYGFEHNKIYPGKVGNGWINMIGTRSGTGWFNSNEIIKGDLFRDSNVNPTLPSWGFRLGTPGDTYQHNNNVFKSQSIQLNQASSVPWLFTNGKGNHVYDFRNEGNSGVAVVFQGTASENIVESGYNVAGTSFIDSSLGGTNKYFDTKQLTRTYADAYKIFDWKAKGNAICYGDGTNINISGLGIYNVSGVPVNYTLQSNIGIYPDFIELKTNNAGVGFELETTVNKEFLVKQTVVSGYSGRIQVAMFDTAGALIDNTTPYKVQMSGTTPSWLTLYGSGWRIGVNTDADTYIRVPDVCKKIKVILSWNNPNTFRLKSLSVHAFAPSTNNLVPSFGDGLLKTSNVATAVPNYFGTYEDNQIIYRANMNTGESAGWAVKTSGTMRTLTSASGSITSGTNVLAVTGVSVDSIYVGEYLNVNSVKFRVIRKSGSNLYLSANAGSTYSGTINYYPAAFTELLGSSGGGALMGDLD